MFRRIALALGSFILAAAVYPAYVIGVSLGAWQPLTRPRGVSSRAHYVDAFKSEAWFDCSIDLKKDVNPCRAWNENGALIAFGNYRLDGQNRAATAVELRPSAVHLYPGHPELAWIDLFGNQRGIKGGTLVPVNDAGQPLERFEVRLGNDPIAPSGRNSSQFPREHLNDCDFSAYTPMRISDWLPGGILKAVKPLYPAEAKLHRVAGLVKVGILINKQGRVERVCSTGPEALRPAAEVAASEYRFRRLTINEGTDPFGYIQETLFFEFKLD